MRTHKATVILLLLVICASIVVPLPVYAASPTDHSSKGFLTTLLDALVSIFHLDLNPKDTHTNTTTPVQTRNTSGGKDVLGFYTEWFATDTTSYHDLVDHIDTIGTIAPFWSTLHSDGSVTDRGGNDHASVVKYAHNNKVTALLMVNNAKQENSNSDIHTVLSDSSLRKTAIDNLESYIKKYNLDGINIDFEQVPASDRDHLTAFMRELADRLKPQGYIVSIDVFPKHNEENDVAVAYDYAALANYADKIILMTYDYHAGWNGAGSIADIRSVESDLKYALTLIPKNKIYLGIAGYGYDWSSKGVESVENDAIHNLITRFGATIQWDEASQSPHFNYTETDSTNHEVWYENSQSLKYKLDLVNQYNIAGIALWKLGGEDPASWQVIKDKLK
ncbi:glycosyl hydrolase family 18 protein [Pelosinus sp. sgz500959]|uniref:glycosyl hydrolase family 18 protein n=1 Tax=Pelosinus sp. sgz500959 TaxID=3242472 RepID=UPI00366B76DF